MSFKAETFSEHIEPFLSYRQQVGYATGATVRSDRIDLRLFENHLLKNNIEIVNGTSVIAFQEYLSAVRKNSPPSANRKITCLKSLSGLSAFKRNAAC